MKIERDVRITLTPAEASEIIKTHLNKEHPDLNIEKIHFNIKTVYDGGYGDRDDGHEVMNEVTCTGKLK